ncbi:hypothetical protein CHS0354_022373 [Potamilus streckersoni]|uniref:CARD domain-containing protein n=1 Tax=Potamilus streckersoni TaxID=2493646 RepID=A0AAE0SXP5_9BIVA|nr:hypothetical protein CHS0354_022373 [Potamilus streckersoni]
MNMETFKRKVNENREELLKVLHLNKDFLAYLTQVELIDATDYVRLQQIEDERDRRQVFLEILLAKSGSNTYPLFIDSLLKMGQGRIVHLLMDVREEIAILKQQQTELDNNLKEMADFLLREERRSGVYLTEPPEDDSTQQPALTEKEVWESVQRTIKESERQLKRCQSVIEKLHQDCEAVAKANSEIIEQSRQIDAKIRDVVSRGRKSAKGAPKKTQDVFSNLMDDVEKLVKSRKKVLDQETEGKRHSTRIVRQCRDWIEDRTLVLAKLNDVPGPGAFRSLNISKEGRMVVQIQRTSPGVHENAVMSILEALQLLERELQQYIHLEISLADKYKAELRRKTFQRQNKGFTPQGITDALGIIDLLKREPENAKHHFLELRTVLEEIGREYDVCVSYIDKLNSIALTISSSDSNNKPIEFNRSPKIHRRTQQQQPREWPNNMIRRAQSDKSTVSQSLDEGLQKVGVTPETNQLLSKLKLLVTKYEELGEAEQSAGQRFRIELSKKKREWDLALQKKEDDLLQLQTQLKEVEAEKEKYKKLYNDTKIGYQKNSGAK